MGCYIFPQNSVVLIKLIEASFASDGTGVDTKNNLFLLRMSI